MLGHQKPTGAPFGEAVDLFRRASGEQQVKPRLHWDHPLQLIDTAKRRHGIAETEASVRYHEAAAARGHAEACMALGHLYSQGAPGLTKNHVTALSWYCQAAEQGVVAGMARLGTIFLHGRRGVPKDFREALRWSSLGAGEGSAEAQCNLGLMYFQSRGVKRDVKKALQLNRLAVDAGWPEAHYHEAGMHYNTIGGAPADMWKVHELLSYAAQHGYEPAQAKLRAIFPNREALKRLPLPSPCTTAEHTHSNETHPEKYEEPREATEVRTNTSTSTNFYMGSNTEAFSAFIRARAIVQPREGDL